MLEGLNPSIQAGDSISCARLIHRNLARAVQVPTDKGNLPKRLLRKDAELEGKPREENRGVVVTQMVRSIDGRLTNPQLLFTDEGNRRQAEDEKGSRPKMSDEVLLPSGLVPQTTEKRDTTEEDRRGENKGYKEEVCQPAKESWSRRPTVGRGVRC